MTRSMAPLVDLCQWCFEDTLGGECPTCVALYHHHVGEDWQFDPHRVYDQTRRPMTASFKPRGLWLSYPDPVYGDTWTGWKVPNEYGSDWWFRWTVVVDRTRLLRVELMDNLPDEWMMPDHSKYGADDPEFGARWRKEQYPNWPLIFEHYAGFDNALYERAWEADWDRRYSDDYGWHYNWDCSSVVIWDLSAVVWVGDPIHTTRPDREDAVAC